MSASQPVPPNPNAPARPLQKVEAGDHALMRKRHPCGSLIWAVTRVGADIGLRCEGCGRRVMLPRDLFYRNARRLLPTDGSAEADLWNPDAPTDAPPGGNG